MTIPEPPAADMPLPPPVPPPPPPVFTVPAEAVFSTGEPFPPPPKPPVPAVPEY